MKRIWMVVVAFCGTMLLVACTKEVPGTTKIEDILKEEAYIRVRMGEAYLQEEVTFDMEGDRAVVPSGAAWGLPKYREKENAGISYGDEGGAEVYETDMETTPELYESSYLDTLRNLGLTVEDIRDSGYDVKVIEKEALRQFEEELTMLSGMVIKDAYKLTGVSIRFDEQFRPIKKEFQLEKKEKTRLDNEKVDSEKCTQEFSYDVGKVKFNTAFEKVKKEIDKDM